MTPQTCFTLLAPIIPQREAELRRLLESMNDAPGCAKPANALFPFGQFEALHYARFLIVDDKTLDDVRLYGLPPRKYPLYLAFAGDVDGESDSFLAEAARRASQGLRELFSCCEGFTSETDLVQWMTKQSCPVAANYVNWIGRTVLRVREDAAMRGALEKYLEENDAKLGALSPREIHATLLQFVKAEQTAGRLTLSAENPTPADWQISNLLNLVGVPLLILITSPVLIVIAVIFLIRLRQLEKSDPEFCPRVEQTYSDGLALLEDHDVTNQFSVMGSLKPGIVRLWTTKFVLWIVDYGARHIFTRGRLARVRSIHFARWVFLDAGQRLLFLSNYDGSLESYMDDFINKVGFGLNASFSAGIGYPRTNWLVLDGCADERKFKDVLRRHQMPTQVWYKAYPGLTAVELERNGLIRDGLDSLSMSDQEALDWLALL